MYRSETLGCIMGWSGLGYSANGQVEGPLMFGVMYSIGTCIVCVCLMECVVSIANHVPW